MGDGVRPRGRGALLRLFRHRHPEFDAARLSELRQAEYGRLDTQEQVYLDYTGGGLFAESQLSGHVDLLRSTVLGNPHSVNPTSAATSEFLERAREAVLRYFDARGLQGHLHAERDRSPQARRRGIPVRRAQPPSAHVRQPQLGERPARVRPSGGRGDDVVPSTAPSLRIDDDDLKVHLRVADEAGNNLFAYPAQSNFSGVQHPLEWIPTAQTAGWDVLVDCAAFVPANRLDLCAWQPDFVPISLYKLLGYPTGVGCLLVRERALARLRHPWFAGGTIAAVSVQETGTRRPRAKQRSKTAP